MTSVTVNVTVDGNSVTQVTTILEDMNYSDLTEQKFMTGNYQGYLTNATGAGFPNSYGYYESLLMSVDTDAEIHTVLQRFVTPSATESRRLIVYNAGIPSVGQWSN